MSRITVVVNLEAKDGEFENLLRLAREQARRSMHEEPGCLKFEVLRPKEHPARLIFVEHYASQAALDHHLDTERIKAFRESMLPIVSSRDLTFCDVEKLQGGWPTMAAVPWWRSRGGGLMVAKNRHDGRAAG